MQRCVQTRLRHLGFRLPHAKVPEKSGEPAAEGRHPTFYHDAIYTAIANGAGVL